MTVSTPDDTTPHPSVVAGVVFVDARSLRVSVEAVKRQVYEVDAVIVIGGGDEAAAISQQVGVEHVSGYAPWLDGMGTAHEFVWLVHGDARPRPDALGALVDEAVRNDASLIGSKVLDASDPRLLESIGSSTDVFGESYTGLDPHEVDLEQYDVVRDVSSVSTISVLVRRDLLRGLGGPDPLLGAPEAGQDLSQRARLAGGRVMVVPSSEVLHVGVCRRDQSSWLEQAGRMRSMFKAYRLPTLLWVVPVGLVIGLFDGIARILLGSFRPLSDLVRAFVWNLLRMPTTIEARRRLSRIRVAGDEELFRYQVGGSVLIRNLMSDVGERLGWIVDDEPGVVTEQQLASDSKLAGPVVAGLGLLLVGIGTRVVWLSTRNAVGFWLPPHEQAGSVLASYAGGWNPAGLGTPLAVHPSVAFEAALQWILGGWRGAMPLIAGMSLLGGFLGISRLLDRLGIEGASRHLAGIVYLIGPFAGRFTVVAYWPGLIALGALPWLIDALVVRWPLVGRRRVGRIAQMVVSAGLVSAFAPFGTVVGVAATVLGAVTLARFSWLRAMGWSIVAMVVGADLVAPYLLGAAPSTITNGSIGVDIWPHPIALIAAAVAVVAAVFFGRERASRVAGWGGGMVALALLGSIWVPTGEVVVALVLMASLGLAVLVGAAFDIDLERSKLDIVGQAVAAAAGALILFAGVIAVPEGRAGMPADQWGGALTFADELVSGTQGERVLIVGSPDSLPGAMRLGNGYAYRLVSGATPTFDQAWLGPPRIGDRALEQALAIIDTATDVRPGLRLAPFAIRWVVVVDEAPILESLRSQVDLAERGFDPTIAVFENLSFRGRVTASDGSAWTSDRVSASGPASASSRIRVADNADPGWTPDWNQDEWANSLSASEGRVTYANDPLQAGLAWASLVIMLVATGLAIWGRERRT